MKILRIRGKNLTTFDQFDVNFEGEKLKSVGLFAITGPTGSGKSTLLDAICLALYGRTPRYTNHGGIKIGLPDEDDRKKVLANDPRALMSYGAGLAEAEVDFSRNERRYRVKWFVKRARQKPDGALQTPQQVIHEIFDESPEGEHLKQLPSGEYYRDLSSSKVSVTRRNIEVAIGLKYDEFCRTVFLAQGEFDAFLMRDDDRARLLELITGDQLYSKISEIASDRLKSVETKLSELKSEQEEGLLSEDEAHSRLVKLQAVTARFEELSAERRELNATTSASQRALARARELIELSESRARLDEELTLLHDQAHPLSSKLIEHEALIRARLDYESEVEVLKERRAELVIHEATDTEAQTQLSSLKETAEQTRMRRDELSKLNQSGEMILERLERARERFNESEAHVNQLRVGLEEVSETRSVQLQTVTELEEGIHQLQDELTRHESWIVSHHQREHLVSHRERWSAIFEHLQNLGEAYQKQQSEQQRLQGQLSALSERDQELYQRQSALQREFERRERDLNALQERVSQQGLEDTQRREERNLEAIQLIKEAQKTLGDLKRHVEELSDLEARVGSQRQSCDTLTEHTRDDQLQVSMAEARLQEVRRASQSYEELKMLEPMREQLTEGDPCPLCGSTEHPGVPDKLLEVNERAQERLRELGEALTQLQAQKSVREAELFTAQSELKWLERQANQALDGCRAHFDTWNALGGNALWRELIEASTLLKVHLHLNERSARDGTLEIMSINEELSALLTQQDELKNSLIQSAARLSLEQERIKELEGEQQRDSDQLKELREERAELDERQQGVQKLFEALSRDSFELNAEVETHFQELNHYSLEPISPSSPAELRSHYNQWLESCAEWSQRRSLYTAQTEELARRDQALKGAHAQLRELASTLEERKRELARVEPELAERRRTIDELQPLVEEAHQSAQRLQALESELETLRIKRDELNESALERQRQIGALRAQILSGESSLQLHQESLNHLRSTVGLTQAELEELMKARGELEEGEFDQIRSRHTQLESQRSEVMTQLAELSGPLDLLVTRMVELDLISETLARSLNQGEASAFSDLEARCGELTATLNALEDQLNEAVIEKHQHESLISRHEQVIARRGAESEEVKLARAEVTKWRQINNALGGSGKHTGFNAYAQQFTLSLIIEHANYYLNQLMRRYQLMMVRDERKPLNFQVIDRDLGDEPRSVNSLSGGESFLISLALALGLSSTTSHDTHIESLFIDEGFGTLDPDSLDMAISMLDQLQLSGVQIGIISHVEGISERVGTRLEIKKTGAGKSDLQIKSAQDHSPLELGLIS